MLKGLGKIFLQLLKKILQYKYLCAIIFALLIFISMERISVINKSKYNGKEKNFELIVQDKKSKKNEDIVTLNGKEKLILYTKDFPYDIGDIVSVEGKLSIVNNNTIPNTFNYHKYLQSRRIYWQLQVNKVKLIKKNQNIVNKVKSTIISKINKYQYKEYLYAFILGDTSYFNEDVRYKYQINGLSYLLAIGSIQVMVIIELLEKGEKLLKIKKKRRIIINIFIILLYILFTNKIIGVLRSGLCYIIKSILHYYKIKVHNYNIVLFVGGLLLLFNPYYIINMGFLYSFSISLAISIIDKRIRGKYFKRLLIISIIAFIISLPITIYNNYEVNFLAIIFSLLLVPIFTYIVFPLSVIVFIFPFLFFIFNFIISFVEYLVDAFSQIDFLTFVFKKPSMVIIIMYYIAIVLSLWNKKYSFILFLIIVIHININLIIKEDMITFLDVKEADAIVYKKNNSLSLIDTGGSLQGGYSREIIKYIKSLGISQINQLILTHGDFDHMGEAINLVNSFKVGKVIFNCGEFNDLEQELIKVLNKKQIKHYSCIKELNIDNNKLYFLQTKEYDNENDNSNVIYTELDGYKFMFMGDAGIEKEKDILEKYNLSNIDVLKAGHHGSRTSSSKEFIKEINPKYSVISVGKNNRYGHPNKTVLENLKESKLYRTDEDGSIMFKIKNNKLKVETCSP